MIIILMLFLVPMFDYFIWYSEKESGYEEKITTLVKYIVAKDIWINDSLIEEINEETKEFLQEIVYIKIEDEYFF